METILKQAAEEARLVGASLVVIKNDTPVVEACYGYSSIEENKKTTMDTVYRIASVSKVIVALCIMRLVEEKLVDIDEDISSYLGFLIRNPHHPTVPITLKMLMTQTSSITDGAEDESSGYNLVNGTNQKVGLRDLLLTSGSHYAVETFDLEKPGTHFIYSNFGCGILACIIEKVTNCYFTDYVREIILKPLKLDASFIPSDIKQEDIASLYGVKNNQLVLVRSKAAFLAHEYDRFPLGENYRGPAGGLFISMRDLSTVMMLFLNNGAPLFKKETIDLMLAKHWEGIGTGNYRQKGLQVKILNYKDRMVLKGHFGDAYGARSFMLFNQVKQMGICFITNGGFIRENPSGFCDVHEKIIDAFIAKYGG